MRKTYIASLIMLSMSTLVNAASFDCKKKTSAIEHTICSDEILSELDGLIAKVYFQLAGQPKMQKREVVRNEQLAWLATRNAHCDDLYECMEVHAKRLLELKKQLSPILLSSALSSYTNMNQLAWDRNFRHITSEFLSTAKTITINSRPIKPLDLISEALGGAPELLEHSGNLLIGRACAAHACDNKGIVLYDSSTGDLLYGAIVVMPDQENPSSTVLIFYKNKNFLNENYDIFIKKILPTPISSPVVRIDVTAGN